MSDTDTDLAETPPPANAPTKKPGIAHRLYTGEISYDFVGHRKRWYLISGILLLISIAALGIRGLNWGIEFTGGAEFTATTTVTDSTVDDVRRAVADLGVAGDDLNVTTIGSDTVRVQTEQINSESSVAHVKEAIAKAAGTQPDAVDYSLIGASWGQQISTQALIALGVFMVLVMALIWIYFREIKMSISAIVALVHDLVITVGVYALVGFSVTPATMIGVLTILGYSLYDTMVVFDKTRENTRDLEHSKHTFSYQANMALNQVLVRSINTTIIGVLPVAALLFAGWFVLGTGPLKDLGLALFVGMVIGAYSSVFIATPLMAQMRESDADMKEHRERLARREARASEKAARKPKSVTVAVGDAPTVDVEVSTLGLVSAKDLTDRPRRQPAKQPRSKRKK